MAKNETEDEIKALITELRIKKKADGAALKAEVQQAFERVKPINLIKSTIKDASASKEVSGSITSAALIFVTSYLSKRIFMRLAGSPLKKLTGAVLLFGITQIIARNPEKVKAIGSVLFNAIKGKSRKQVN